MNHSNAVRLVEFVGGGPLDGEKRGFRDGCVPVVEHGNMLVNGNPYNVASRHRYYLVTKGGEWRYEYDGRVPGTVP